jgi:integrase
MKKEGKQSSAIENYMKPVILYYKLNDVMLNTKQINRFIPERRRIKKDRAYTHAEISKMLDIADEKMRAVILLLCSSGIHIGTVPDIRLRNLEDNKLTVYENTTEEMFYFHNTRMQKSNRLLLEYA